MATIAISTLAGNEFELQLSSDATIRDAKCELAMQLGKPADLQRWLHFGAVLEDDDEVSAFTAVDCGEPLQVLCVFLPRTFNVNVKVIKYSPGFQAQQGQDVSIAVSPTTTVDGAKLEAVTAVCGLGCGSLLPVARLIKGGMHLHDDKTIEYYRIDPDTTLHLVLPRSGEDQDPPPGNASAVINTACDDLGLAGLFQKASAESDIIKKSDGTRSSDSSETVIDLGIDGSRCLSPRTKQGAMAFNTMGRYPLRPQSARRSASTPPMKPGECQVNAGGLADLRKTDETIQAQAQRLTSFQLSVNGEIQENATSVNTVEPSCARQPASLAQAEKPEEQNATQACSHIVPLRPQEAAIHRRPVGPLKRSRRSSAATSPSELDKSVSCSSSNRPPLPPKMLTQAATIRDSADVASIQHRPLTVKSIASELQLEAELLSMRVGAAPPNAGAPHVSLHPSNGSRPAPELQCRKRVRSTPPAFIDRWHFVTC